MIESPCATERASILDGLESADEEVRRLSVEQIALLPVAEATPILAGCLGDESWRVRKAGVERLVAMRDHASVHEMLVAALADGENPGRRNSAFEALVGCGTRVTGRLVEELNSSDVDVRKLVVDALAAIGDPSALGALATAIDDPDPNVRAAVAEALGVVGGSGEIETLMSAATASSEDPLVRLSAMRALARMEASVGVVRLGDALENSLLRPAVFELLGTSTDPDAIDTLIKGLASGSRSSREAAMAALLRVLGGLDDPESEHLRHRLRDACRANSRLVELGCERLEGADLCTRMTLVQFLGLVDDPAAAVPILKAGRDEAIQELADGILESMGALLPEALAPDWETLDVDLKARACLSLGGVGGPDAERLLTAALDAHDSGLRCNAALAVVRGGFFERLPDLVRRLELAAREDETDGIEEIETLIGAIVGLAECPGATAAGVEGRLIEMLSVRLNGAMEPVRLAIARVLARIGRSQDEGIIGDLLRDESPAVRRAAVQALGRFEFDHVRENVRVALVDESSAVRIAAAHVIGDSQASEAFEDLERLLEDRDPRVVAVAVRSCGRFFRRADGIPDEAYRVIEGALESDAIVVLAGIDALMELGEERAGDLAVRVLDRSEPEVVRSAVACVGAHGAQAHLIELIALISHPDWSVRAEAVQVLTDRVVRRSLPALLRRLEFEDDPFVREAILRATRKLEE